MRYTLLLLLAMVIFNSCDPLYALFLKNDTNKTIIFRTIEEDSIYALDFKLSMVNSECQRMEYDSSFINRYFIDSLLYTEIKLEPNEFVNIKGGFGKRPNYYLISETYDIIVDQDTFEITGKDLLDDMILEEESPYYYYYHFRID